MPQTRRCVSVIKSGQASEASLSIGFDYGEV